MKLRGASSSNQGLTLVEVLVVIFSLLILTATLLATVSAPRIRNSIGCVSQLKQAGPALAGREGGGNDQSSPAMSATNFSAEVILQGMSNQLVSPRILVCPADKGRVPAAGFRSPLKADNISYFINLNGSESNPRTFLMGDDNLALGGARVKSGVLTVSNQAPLSWTPERHRFYGNVALADGSVQGINNLGLRGWLRATNSAVMRLALP